AHVAPRKMSDKSTREDRSPFHLTLLAKNQVGYHNLMKLSTQAWLDGFYYKPRIDRDLIEQYSEGLIALTGCIGGEVGSNILADNYEAAREAAQWHAKVFGKDHYYLEMQPHIGWEPQDKVNAGLRKLAKELDLPLVVTGDAHYSRADQHYAHDILLCVQTGSTMEDPNRFKLDQDLSIYSAEQIAERFPDDPEALSNTVKIAEMCDVEIELGKILIPTFAVPDGRTEREYLRSLVFQGAMWRYSNIPKEDIGHITEDKAKAELPTEVIERIEYELEVTARMGYDGYFLIVADLINWSKNQGIICGPGRGSAAGSILAYVTNITDLDPLRYGLLFERFLNPDRISMPDIDMDYADDRRDEVISYATEKYGQDHVAQIITFGTMAARNAVRDTGRVLAMPYGEVDAIAKLVPQPIQGRHIPLAVSIKDNPDLKHEYESNPRSKRLIDIAMQLEGTIRNAGTHAAGVVIAPAPLVEYLPLTRASKGGVATQFVGTTVEDLGLLKFDFLGLSNLTIIKNALRIIKRVYGVTIDVTQIPIDDKATYELLARGETTGVFQLESAGMKRYIRELKPDRFEDIIAMVALYRPGPMQWIEDFIGRKHNPERIRFDHPKMEAALKETYGIIVYQEQVMQISKDLCGFTGGQADTLRKGIGKKIPEVIAKMKTDFIEGAIATSDANPAFVEKLWGSIEDFAAYCFNKSHAACYALIAVQTAYLKAHYPAAFMAALLTSDHGNLDRVGIEVAECRKMGIDILPPDVNESYSEFAVKHSTEEGESDVIRFGLAAIKNVGLGPIEAILKAREDGEGPFTSIEDFVRRVDAREVNKKTLEALMKVGAFDTIGDRATLISNLDKIVSYMSKAQKNALSGQIDIFGSMGIADEMPSLPLDPPDTVIDQRQFLQWEKELLGLYVSSHPLQEVEPWLREKTTPASAIKPEMDDQKVMVGGIITTVRKILTKKGDNMAFVGLETLDGEIELLVFPRAYELNQDLWVEDKMIAVSGKVNAKDREGKRTDEVKVMVDRAKSLDTSVLKHYIPTGTSETPDVQPDAVQSLDRLIITVPDLKNQIVLIRIKALLQDTPGETETILELQETGQKIRLPYKVAVSEKLKSLLADIVPSEAILAE
ncbi:DNA polymerase III subunit alpha, partial [Candidatus Saccharibacteria bacterium]|nr:DNA polymerase III subunit alpha [Candidatus Saccharibacteria bacterium]